jgi:hypothetical protein
MESFYSDDECTSSQEFADDDPLPRNQDANPVTYAPKKPFVTMPRDLDAAAPVRRMLVFPAPNNNNNAANPPPNPLPQPNNPQV